MIEGKRFSVSGRVQRVGYRAFVLHAARNLGIAGTVWNSASGTVECEAYGKPEALSRLEQLLNEGPALAHVESVTVMDIVVADDASIPDEMKVGHDGL